MWEGQQSGAAAAEETACEKAVTRENGGPITNPECCPFPVRYFFSVHLVSHGHQEFTSVHLLCVCELWIPYALQT